MRLIITGFHRDKAIEHTYQFDFGPQSMGQSSTGGLHYAGTMTAGDMCPSQITHMSVAHISYCQGVIPWPFAVEWCGHAVYTYMIEPHSTNCSFDVTTGFL